MIDAINITIGERTLLMCSPGLGVLCEAAERVGELRRTEFDEALQSCRGLNGEALQAALSRAIESQQAIVTDEEILNWLQSPPGETFLFWRSARELQPDIDEQAAALLFALLDCEQVEQLAEFFVRTFSRQRSTGEVTL